MLSILFIAAMVAFCFLAINAMKNRKRSAAIALACIALMLSLPLTAEAGNCGVSGVAAVQVSGFHQPAFVQSFGVPVHPQFVSSRGVFVAAPHASPVFVQAVPGVHFRSRGVNVNVNAIRGQQFRQVQTRGVLGRQRTVTTIR